MVECGCEYSSAGNRHINVQGTWTLNIADTVQQDTGRLLEWCLLPLSQGECDAADVSQQNRMVNIGEHLVCNAGFYSSTAGSVDSNGSLSVNFSGHVEFNQLQVRRVLC
jgi:subtilisin-like proprotein convertase family protein